MRSISSFESADPPEIVIDCSLLVFWSFADTCTIPLVSISKVTSIRGTPIGAGRIPVSWKVPSDLLSRVKVRSPWNTWISTESWLSSAVEKISECLVGIALLRLIRVVITPPLVSIPSDKGVTSIRRTSLRSPWIIPVCRAAPVATTSSGLTDLLASFPPVKVFTISATAGIRVEPPTSTTWSISDT